MIIHNLEHGKGKTTKAIEQAHKTGAYMIVKNREDAVRVARMAEDMGLNIRFPITWDEFLNSKMRGSFVRNIIIDDAERMFLSMFQGLDIEMITMNLAELRTKQPELNVQDK